MFLREGDKVFIVPLAIRNAGMHGELGEGKNPIEANILENVLAREPMGMGGDDKVVVFVTSLRMTPSQIVSVPRSSCFYDRSSCIAAIEHYNKLLLLLEEDERKESQRRFLEDEGWDE